MSNPTIVIRRTYTLPESREGQGRAEVEREQYDADDYRAVPQWAAETLANAGVTRHNRGAQYVTEEPKVTDSSRGEEMTATGEVLGIAEEDAREIYRLMGEWQ
jgi:hypothetical protein